MHFTLTEQKLQQCQTLGNVQQIHEIILPILNSSHNNDLDQQCNVMLPFTAIFSHEPSYTSPCIHTDRNKDIGIGEHCHLKLNTHGGTGSRDSWTRFKTCR